MLSYFASLVIFGFVFQVSHGIEVNVTNGDKLCLYANLMLNFTVAYNKTDNTSAVAQFELPSTANSSSSKCEAQSSTLELKFGEGHTWSVTFSLKDKVYQADLISFKYNLSDATIFPDANPNGTANVSVKAGISGVGVDTCYSCKSKDEFQADNVNMTLWNVLIQAFVTNGSKSENKTSCAADLPVTTTAAPTTHATATTSAAPVTNATTAAPPTPTPTIPTPAVGNYSLKSSENATACLLLNLGLRVGFKLNGTYQEMNFDPKGVNATGFCGGNSSELRLQSEKIDLNLTFVNDIKKFQLRALSVAINTTSGVFSDHNNTLSLWEASVGSSYMCNKEQNYTINDQLSIYTFSLHVQPFGVKKGLFSTAQECSVDDTSILIPIIVGAALAGLILIVVIAYVIGRRKTHVGYQTL